MSRIVALDPSGEPLRVAPVEDRSVGSVRSAILSGPCRGSWLWIHPESHFEWPLPVVLRGARKKTGAFLVQVILPFWFKLFLVLVGALHRSIPSILWARPAHVDSSTACGASPEDRGGSRGRVSITSKKRSVRAWWVRPSGPPDRGGFSWFWSEPSTGQSRRSFGLAPHMWSRSTACGANPEDRGDSRGRETIKSKNVGPGGANPSGPMPPGWVFLVLAETVPRESPRFSGLAARVWIRSTACGASPGDRGKSRGGRFRPNPGKNNP